MRLARDDPFMTALTTIHYTWECRLRSINKSIEAGQSTLTRHMITYTLLKSSGKVSGMKRNEKRKRERPAKVTVRLFSYSIEMIDDSMLSTISINATPSAPDLNYIPAVAFKLNATFEVTKRIFSTPTLYAFMEAPRSYILMELTRSMGEWFVDECDDYKLNTFDKLDTKLNTRAQRIHI